MDSKSPAIILMHGLPATGKTTIALAIVGPLQADYLASDEIRKDVYAQKLPFNPEISQEGLQSVYTYLDSHPKHRCDVQAIFAPFRTAGLDIADPYHTLTFQQREAVYQAMVDSARTFVQQGRPVIIDATHIDKKRRQSYQQLAQDLNIPLYIVSVVCTPVVIEKRLVQRKDGLSGKSSLSQARTWQIYWELAERAEPITADEGVLITCDTANRTFYPDNLGDDRLGQSILLALRKALLPDTRGTLI